MNYLKVGIVFIFVVVFIAVVSNLENKEDTNEETLVVKSIYYDCDDRNSYESDPACEYSITTEDDRFFSEKADTIERLCYKLDDDNVTCDIEVGKIKKNGEKKIQYFSCTDYNRNYYCAKNSNTDVDRVSSAEKLARDLCVAYLDADRKSGAADNSIPYEIAYKKCRSQRYLTEKGYMQEEEYDQIVDNGQEVR